MPLANRRKVLLMKDEMGGVPIKEFISLGAKQYAILSAENQEVKKVKGITHSAVKRHINFDDYKRALFENAVERREQTTIQSKNHNLFTVKRMKVALRSVDDKRVQVENYRTLPYGHVALRNSNNDDDAMHS